jgi:hypothetical protein
LQGETKFAAHWWFAVSFEGGVSNENMLLEKERQEISIQFFKKTR